MPRSFPVLKLSTVTPQCAWSRSRVRISRSWGRQLVEVVVGHRLSLLHDLTAAKRVAGVGRATMGLWKQTSASPHPGTRQLGRGLIEASP